LPACRHIAKAKAVDEKSVIVSPPARADGGKSRPVVPKRRVAAPGHWQPAQTRCLRRLEQTATSAHTSVVLGTDEMGTLNERRTNIPKKLGIRRPLPVGSRERPSLVEGASPTRAWPWLKVRPTAKARHNIERRIGEKLLIEMETIYDRDHAVFIQLGPEDVAFAQMLGTHEDDLPQAWPYFRAVWSASSHGCFLLVKATTFLYARPSWDTAKFGGYLPERVRATSSELGVFLGGGLSSLGGSFGVPRGGPE
jgi:hypothetical protein